ncbi:hypothetical protein Mal52_45300 [Symmachiella dynata]|uniref:Uncharacterized protein n=1 Tax=Symmachiella dynata TaxID=2527995 RepID=A0A517ZU75_9PLAN|nr:hypothetical protein Mal52_45300 [Symmachiella dynata]
MEKRVEFDVSYNLTCKLTLDSGRDIVLEQLYQERTYRGLLEGTPNRVANDWGIEHNLSFARKLAGSIGDPYLIAPNRRDYVRVPGDMDRIREDIEKRIGDWEEGLQQRLPEWIPFVCCIGCFASVKPARDSRKDCSSLTVVWYQDNFAMPIDPVIQNELRSLNWNEHATDGEY